MAIQMPIQNRINPLFMDQNQNPQFEVYGLQIRIINFLLVPLHLAYYLEFIE